MKSIKITTREGVGLVEVGGVNIADHVTACSLVWEKGLWRATFTLLAKDVEIDIDKAEIQGARARTGRELEDLEADTEEYLRCGRCNTAVDAAPITGQCQCGGPLIECVRVVDGPNTRLVRRIGAYLDAGGSDDVVPIIARGAA